MDIQFRRQPRLRDWHPDKNPDKQEARLCVVLFEPVNCECPWKTGNLPPVPMTSSLLELLVVAELAMPLHFWCQHGRRLLLKSSSGFKPRRICSHLGKKERCQDVMDSNFVFFVLHVSCIRSPKIYPAGDFFCQQIASFCIFRHDT